MAICGVCGIGMKNFEETKDDAKLWVPKSSRVLPEKKWVDEMFPEETRFTTIIVTAPNILTPWMINAVCIRVVNFLQQSRIRIFNYHFYERLYVTKNAF